MEIEVKGLEKLEAKLAALSREAGPMLNRAMDTAVKYVHGEVPGYPAQPAGSRYRRTGVLGNSITTEVKSIGSETVGIIGTNTVYAPWVISDETVPSGTGPQAWWHRRAGWYTLQQVVRDAAEKVVEIFDKAVEKWINS